MSVNFAVVERLERRRLLALSPELPILYHGHNGIYLANSDGSNPTKINLTLTETSEPAFSPDRNSFVFTNGFGSSAKIWKANIDGTHQTQLSANTIDLSPRFSPDGSKIVFVSVRDGNSEIYTVNADGSNPVRLTNDAGRDASPSFSPDGTKILFISNRVGNNELYTIDADTGANLTRLTNNTADDIDPTWSPEGRRIAFSSNRVGLYDIWVMSDRGELQGPGAVQLTNETLEDVGDANPSFSPHGTRIAYTRSTPGGETVELIDADDGTSLGRVDGEGIESSPNWSSAPAIAGVSHNVVTVVGTGGPDNITLSAASHTLTVTRGSETTTFSIDDQTQIQVFCGDGKDVLTAGAGTPSFYAIGEGGDDLMIGGPGNDTLSGGSGRNTLFGGDGDDRLNGSGGRDFLYGDGGNDRMYGNAGNDYMLGGGNIDRMWGGDGDDFLAGVGGNDKLFGENGNDQLFGQDGNDQIYGGLGVDTINGGKGTDTADDDDADIRGAVEVVI